MDESLFSPSEYSIILKALVEHFCSYLNDRENPTEKDMSYLDQVAELIAVVSQQL